MALINCPECGRQISDKAEKCVQCGYMLTKSLKSTPIKQNIVEKSVRSDKVLTEHSKSGTSFVYIFIAIFLIFGSVYYFSDNTSNTSSLPQEKDQSTQPKAKMDNSSVEVKAEQNSSELEANESKSENGDANSSDINRIRKILSTYELREENDRTYGAETISIYLKMTTDGTFEYALLVKSNINENQNKALRSTGKYEISGNLNSGVQVHLIGQADGFSIWGKLTKRSAGGGYDFSPLNNSQEGISINNPRVPFDALYTSL